MTAHVICGGCGRILLNGPVPNPHFHVAARCDQCDPDRTHAREEHFILWQPGQTSGRCVFCGQPMTRAYEPVPNRPRA